MDHLTACLGHKKREDRRNIMIKIAASPKEYPDETCRVLIKKGPLSVETSL